MGGNYRQRVIRGYERPQLVADEEAAEREIRRLRRSLEVATQRGDRAAMKYLDARIGRAIAAAWANRRSGW